MSDECARRARTKIGVNITKLGQILCHQNQQNIINVSQKKNKERNKQGFQREMLSAYADCIGEIKRSFFEGVLHFWVSLMS